MQIIKSRKYVSTAAEVDIMLLLDADENIDKLIIKTDIHLKRKGKKILKKLHNF